MSTVAPRKLRCKVCGNTEFLREFRTASSDLACSKCGSVLEENPIVSEVTFAETSNGGAAVQGSFVAADQAHANFGNNRGSLDSREQTLNNAKKRIRNVASAMGMDTIISDSAFNWFQLALTQNFVQGRRSQNVVAACLYLACRMEKKQYMLIDFSARLQTSVYAIGATFLKLVNILHIDRQNMPMVDPSLFIQSYADKLDFGRKKLKVIDDAVKLAKRMKNDWIDEGRRPAGIAGACLLLAARMNNFRRTHSEIVAVTHIGSMTIQKRLREFQKTQASDLTVEEFRKGGVNAPRSMPPSFQEGRVTERLRKRSLRNHDKMKDKMLDDPVLNAMLEDSEVTEDEIKTHIRRILKRQLRQSARGVNGRACTDKDGHTQVQPEDDEEEDAEAINQDELELEQMIERNKPRNLALCLPSTEEILKSVPDDEDLSTLDDPEIDSFLLSNEESRLKEQIWVGNNQEYLLKQERKRLKEEADKIAGHTVHTRKRKKKNDGEPAEVNDPSNTGIDAYLKGENAQLGLAEALGTSLSPADSARKMLQKKSLSKKINYAAVNQLFEN